MTGARLFSIVIGAIALGACRREATPPASRVSSAPAAPTSIAVAEPAAASTEDEPPVADDGFCGEGLVPLTEDACALVPPLRDADPPRLLVYLHGIVPPAPGSPTLRNVLGVVASAARRAGAAALVPRGVRGIGPKGAKDWLAWPTSPAEHAKHARALVARWAHAKARLEARVRRPFARTYLAGSSNGAYFVAALALRGDLAAFGFPVDGVGAMSGGSTSGLAPDPRAPRPPFYVGYGTYDEDTKKNVAPLVALLAHARWPSKVAEHPLGHGAREVYLDEAFTLWDASP